MRVRTKGATLPRLTAPTGYPMLSNRRCRVILEKVAESYTPPPAVAAAAARGLELRAAASPSNKGGLTTSQAHEQGIGSGVQRAVDLKNHRALSPETVRRMHAFFSRHQKNRAIDPGKTPAQDKGYQAWLLWGGDPGRAWARRIVDTMGPSPPR